MLTGSGQRFPTRQNHLDHLGIGGAFRVHLSVAVGVHGGGHLGVTHQLLLDSYRRARIIQEGAVRVSECVPPDVFGQLRFPAGSADVVLLDG